MNTQVATQKPAEALAYQLNKMEPEFKRALPDHIQPERFQRIAITAINRNPALLGADRKSLLEACLLAAQDGLLPDGREAALVIFGKTVQYMPMVAGIRKKVYQSGEIQSLVARVARQNDVFQVIYGDDEKIVHEPALFNAGDMIAVYAIATYRDGSKAREVMTIDDVNRIRAISRSGNSGPWKDHYEEMAKKTVIRRLSKSLPLSADADEVIRRDDRFYDLDRQPATIQQIPAPKPRTIASRLDSFAAGDEPEEFDPETGEPPDAAAPNPAAGEASAPSDATTALADDGADAAPVDDKIAEALAQGRMARASGYKREAPKPYHYKSRADEAAAWVKGWDEEDMEIKAAEGGTV